MKRQRLLFLCHTIPYPPFQGVEIRALNVLKVLAKRYDVDLFCFHRLRDGHELAASVEALRAYATVRAFVVPQSTNRFRLAWDHLRSIVSGRPYTYFMYGSEEFRRAVADAVRQGHYAIAHVDSVADLAGHLDLLTGIPTAGTHHNVESELLERRARIEGGFLRRAYMRFQARLMRRGERDWCDGLPLNLAVSEPDRVRFTEIAPDARFEVITNGVDTDYFQPTGSVGEGVVFVGGATWFPNRDALEYFATSILSRVRSRVKELRVRWVGNATEVDRGSFGRGHQIELTGRVDDIRPYVHGAACYIVPLRVGGGTRLKILDAWAMGKAVVSTPIGCEGLETRHGENILIADDAETFAAAVVDVLLDPELRNRLGAAGRRTAEQTYSWDRIGERLIPLYDQLATQSFPSPNIAALEPR